MEVYIIKMSNGVKYTYFNEDGDYKRGLGQAKGQCTKMDNDIKLRRYHPGRKLSFEVWYCDEKDPLYKILEHNK